MSSRPLRHYDDLDDSRSSGRGESSRRRSRSPPPARRDYRRDDRRDDYRDSRRDRRPDPRDRQMDYPPRDHRDYDSRAPPPPPPSSRRRSRSPVSRSRRDYSPRRDGGSRRDRSPSPYRRDRARDRSPGGRNRQGSSAPDSRQQQKGATQFSLDDVADQQPEDEEAANAQMMATMGFGGFGSTAGEHVAGNSEVGAVKITEQRKYRQYMNRAGGFNRPLDKMI